LQPWRSSSFNPIRPIGKKPKRLEKKIGEVKKDDVQSWLGLAEWCRQEKLLVAHEYCYRSILKLDPEHADARSKLGFAELDGKWLSAVDQLVAKKSDGHVLFGTAWVKADEAAELLKKERKKVGWDFDLKLQTSHWALYTDADIHTALHVLKVAEATYEAFVADMVGTLPLKAPAEPMRVYLFKDKARYLKEARLPAAWAEGYYHSERLACFCYYDARNDKNPTHWFVHEAVHQLMFELIAEPVDLTNWVSEGYACYFGTSKLVNGALKLGQIDPDTYPAWWRDKYVPENFMSLSDLADKIGPALERQRDPNPFYLQSWLFVHYLLHGEEGKYRDAFRKFLVQGYQGKSRTPTFEKTVAPLADLQPGYLKYAKEIQKR
jgi:hypothetical protein